MTSQALFASDCIPAGSLHFIPFDSADLPCYKILCSGFLNGPLPYGMLLEVSPKERRTSIGYSTHLPRSAVGVTRLSWGWLLNIPFLVVILFFWDPEASAPNDESEQSLLVEMLEVLMRDSSRNVISSLFLVPPLLVDLLVKNSRRSLDRTRWVSSKMPHLWTKKEFLALVGVSVGSRA